MKTLLTLLLVCGYPINSMAQSIDKFSIDSGGAAVIVENIQLIYTIGEVHVNELSAGNFQVSEGFVNPITLRIKLDSKIFLEGPYYAGFMTDHLRSNGLIPTSSPYADNSNCQVTVFNITGSNAIIDWVWIEIRDSGNGITVIAEKSALLLANGQVVASDGTSAVTFEVPIGNYYIMISHRNHLGILTANAVSFSGGTAVLDLTTNNTLIMGGANGIADMGDGKFALYAGDYDGNGQIQNDDILGVLPFIGLSGYFHADVDLNAQVQNTDILHILNPNIGRGEQFANKNLNAKRK